MTGVIPCQALVIWCPLDCSYCSSKAQLLHCAFSVPSVYLWVCICHLRTTRGLSVLWDWNLDYEFVSLCWLLLRIKWPHPDASWDIRVWDFQGLCSTIRHLCLAHGHNGHKVSFISGFSDWRSGVPLTASLDMLLGNSVWLAPLAGLSDPYLVPTEMACPIQARL